MEIRPCSRTELDKVAALWRRCGLTRPWNDPGRDFERALDAPDADVLGGYDGAELIASVMVGFDGHRGWVYYLAVEPARQRQRLGREMMAAAGRWLEARGAPKIQLMVREENAAALGFYAALGFERQPVVTLGRWLEDEGG